MTKTQIKSLIKKAIASLDKAQQCMDVLRNAVDETYDEKYEYDCRPSKQRYLDFLSNLSELCGFDIEDTTIELADYLDQLESDSY